MNVFITDIVTITLTGISLLYFGDFDSLKDSGLTFDKDLINQNFELILNYRSIISIPFINNLSSNFSLIYRHEISIWNLWVAHATLREILLTGGNINNLDLTFTWRSINKVLTEINELSKSNQSWSAVTLIQNYVGFRAFQGQLNWHQFHSIHLNNFELLSTFSLQHDIKFLITFLNELHLLDKNPAKDKLMYTIFLKIIRHPFNLKGDPTNVLILNSLTNRILTRVSGVVFSEISYDTMIKTWANLSGDLLQNINQGNMRYYKLFKNLCSRLPPLENVDNIIPNIQLLVPANLNYDSGMEILSEFD